MVTVYVREVEQLDAQLLGEFLPSEILCLPNLFKTFETYIWDDDDSDTIGPCIFNAAQFISNETGTFLEIIVKIRE